MNATVADQLVARYLARLQAALRDLPAARRDELLEQVSEHIATARAELGAQASEAEIRTLLERLGDPAAIAAEAGQRPDEPLQPPQARPGWLEVATLVLLPIGGIVVPVLGWFVGVALLWTSQRWSARDKLLGTLVVPGGMALPVVLGLFTTSTASCVTSPVPASSHTPTHICTGGSPGWLQVLGPVAWVLLFLAPIATVIYLGVRLRRQPTATA
jgi:HAAS